MFLKSWNEKLKGQPDEVITALLIISGAAIMVIALTTPPLIKVVALGYVLLP